MAAGLNGPIQRRCSLLRETAILNDDIPTFQSSFSLAHNRCSYRQTHVLPDRLYVRMMIDGAILLESLVRADEPLPDPSAADGPI